MDKLQLFGYILTTHGTKFGLLNSSFLTSTVRLSANKPRYHFGRTLRDYISSVKIVPIYGFIVQRCHEFEPIKPHFKLRITQI